MLLNMASLGNCINQVMVLQYKGGDSCSNTLVGVPINSNSALEEFTFCGKYYFRFLRRSFLMSIKPALLLEISDFDLKKVEVFYQGAYYHFYLHNQNVTQDSWQYICLAVSKNQITVIWNGEIQYRGHKFDVSSKETKDMKIWLGGALSFSDSIQNRRFEGMIVNTNFWNSTLQDDDLILITTNNKIPIISEKYNLLSTINLQNSSCIDYLILDVDDVLFQDSKNSENILIEYETDFDSSNYICQGYGGNLTLPKNEEELKTLGHLIIQSEVCVSAFLGLKKSKNNEIVDLSSNSVINLKWHLSQPNGGEAQKCINTWDSYLNDIECDMKRCFFCHIPEKQVFVLRGPIPTDTERKYFVTMNKKLTEIRGITEKECLWNGGKWNFGTNLKLDNITNKMPPVGLKTWNTGLKFKFTQCKKDEFTCHIYGHCIPMNRRCNGFPDCPHDGSDENDCKIMTLGKGYDKRYPSAKNLNSGIYMKVYDITEIDEIHMSYTVNFKIRLQWHDSRITFRNLKPEHTENTLDGVEIEQLWTPKLYIENSNGIFLEAGQKNTGIYGTVTVYQDGSQHNNELSEIDEDYLYHGIENKIQMVNYFVIKLGCKFDLKW